MNFSGEAKKSTKNGKESKLARRRKAKGNNKKAVIPCRLEFNIRINRSGRGYIAVASDDDNTEEDEENDEED